MGSESAERIERSDSRGFMTKLKHKIGSVGMLRPFLVADLETVLDQKEQHVPYAAGVMRVDPAKKLPSKGSISWWFS